jgi:hypothetical protein
MILSAANAPRLEVADVFRSVEQGFLERLGPALSIDQRRAFQAVLRCRTAALGGHLELCDRCGHLRPVYNSCRNRHCPKCQAAARAAWLDARQEQLLPVPYFHVVFTLPHQFGPLALQNQRAVYGILFHAAAETLLEVAANPKNLGARIGLLAVLHTWGQTLSHHPHLHCVVPGGGLSLDGTSWIRSRDDFLLPLPILSAVFRGKFLDFLKRAYRSGQLVFHGRLEGLRVPAAFERLLDESVRQRWVVYAKRPFGGPEQVLKYLARYTHRVAISNHRLVSLEDGRVAFRYKDYADANRAKTMTLAAEEFTRRFLLHVLPSGFVRIRYYGLFSHRTHGRQLSLCRQLLADAEPANALPLPQNAVVANAPPGANSADEAPPSPAPQPGASQVVSPPQSAEHAVPTGLAAEPDAAEPSRPLCPLCGVGHMVVVQRLLPTANRATVCRLQASSPQPSAPAACDTS